jgi:hypothetical protein
MARYDFTNDNGVLKIMVQPEAGLYDPEGMSLAVPSLTLANDTIKIYDSGKYKDSYFLSNIGLIGGAPVTNITEAYDVLSAFIGTVLS